MLENENEKFLNKFADFESLLSLAAKICNRIRKPRTFRGVCAFLCLTAFHVAKEQILALEHYHADRHLRSMYQRFQFEEDMTDDEFRQNIIGGIAATCPLYLFLTEDDPRTELVRAYLTLVRKVGDSALMANPMEYLHYILFTEVFANFMKVALNRDNELVYWRAMFIADMLICFVSWANFSELNNEIAAEWSDANTTGDAVGELANSYLWNYGVGDAISHVSRCAMVVQRATDKRCRLFEWLHQLKDDRDDGYVF